MWLTVMNTQDTLNQKPHIWYLFSQLGEKYNAHDQIPTEIYISVGFNHVHYIFLFSGYTQKYIMRNRVRKTDTGRYSREQMQIAVAAVLQSELSIRESARVNNVNYKTLGRYVKLHQMKGEI